VLGDVFLRNQWTKAHVLPLALLLPSFQNKTVFFQSDFKASLWEERWGRKKETHTHTHTHTGRFLKTLLASTLDYTKGVG